MRIIISTVAAVVVFMATLTNAAVATQRLDRCFVDADAGKPFVTIGANSFAQFDLDGAEWTLVRWNRKNGSLPSITWPSIVRPVIFSDDCGLHPDTSPGGIGRAAIRVDRSGFWGFYAEVLFRFSDVGTRQILIAAVVPGVSLRIVAQSVERESNQSRDHRMAVAAGGHVELGEVLVVFVRAHHNGDPVAIQVLGRVFQAWVD